MTQVDDKSYSNELAAIEERLAAIEEAIKNLTIAIQSLTSRHSSNGVVTAL